MKLHKEHMEEHLTIVAAKTSRFNLYENKQPCRTFYEKKIALAQTKYSIFSKLHQSEVNHDFLNRTCQNSQCWNTDEEQC